MDDGRPGARLFLLPVLALYAALMAPKLASFGKFCDGVVYASIARNLAEGHGSLWRPIFSETFFNPFYEHPTLQMGIQSLAFRIFGDSLLVEGAYGAVAGLLLFAFTALLWRARPAEGTASPPGAWWPILLFVLLPITTYALAINFIENTLAVFTLAAGCLALLALRADSTVRVAAFSALAGIAVLLGFLTNGPVALFPLAVPLAGAIAFRLPGRGRPAAVLGVMLAVSVTAFAGLLLVSGEAALFWRTYLDGQVLASITGARGYSPTRYQVLKGLAREVPVPLAICLIAAAILRIRARGSGAMRNALFFLLVALAGSLPIMVSARQHRHYLFPSYPYWALAIASLFQGVGLRLQEAIPPGRRRQLLVSGAAVMILAGAIVTWREAGTAKPRWRAFHHDTVAQGIVLPPRTLISVCPPELFDGWSLKADLQRIYRASLTTEAGQAFYLTTRSRYCPPPPGYRPIQAVEPEEYLLYAR
jgi:hypothetical protein